jgi:hypothetical protein
MHDLMKVCFNCKLAKSLTQFYSHAQMRDIDARAFLWDTDHVCGEALGTPGASLADRDEPTKGVTDHANTIS